LRIDTEISTLRTIATAGGLMTSGSEATWPLARIVAWVVLAVIAVAVVYTGWIAIANFNRIGV
jgi:hypothetical protein